MNRTVLLLVLLLWTTKSEAWVVYYSKKDSVQMDQAVTERYVNTDNFHLRFWIWKEAGFFHLKIRSLQKQILKLRVNKFDGRWGGAIYYYRYYLLDLDFGEYHFSRDCNNFVKGYYECFLEPTDHIFHVYHFY